MVGQMRGEIPLALVWKADLGAEDEAQKPCERRKSTGPELNMVRGWSWRQRTGPRGVWGYGWRSVGA